ncbi:Non-ribosomal peptide synthetase [Pyrenophora teres f. maculata]|nr:Non-ribosomal peptide synthetase [Pyrenophora teres f. maculata]
MHPGATAVALDATLPWERLSFTIQQVEPRVVLSSANNEKLAHILSQHIRVVDERLKDFESEPNIDLPSVSSSSNVYIVFTSGSTGTPKGAMISHSNFASAITYQQRSLGLSSRSRVYDIVSYAFDVSWSNVLQTLCAGGCLCIPSELERRSHPAQAMLRMHINYAHLTPTVAKLLYGFHLPDLEVMNFIGEPLKQTDVGYWKSRNVRVINTYGPAECTPVATVQAIDMEVLGEPSVGKGVGVQTWVVDVSGEEQKLAAIGTVGELWLRGPLVGQGYLKNFEKTSYAFVENPSWLLRASGLRSVGRKDRIYRTGDMVSYNSDGTISFVGRKDSQVKIRGQRVELGEIVAEVITPADNKESILVAFLQTQKTLDRSAQESRASLKDAIDNAHNRLLQSIPSYMIPAAYVPVERIPMTASGKLDRLALRRKGTMLDKKEFLLATGRHGTRRAPETPTGATIHKLVAELLCIEPHSLSMDDNFIRLGGDSINAIQLISMAREEKLALDIVDVLTARDLAELASKCATTAGVPALVNPIAPFSVLGFGEEERNTFVRQMVSPQIRLRDVKVYNVFPASPTQSAYIEDALRTPRRSWYQFYIDLLPSVHIERLAQTCLRVLNRHEIFRSVFVSASGRFYQAVLENISFSIEQVDSVTGSIEEAFDKYRAQELRRPAALGVPFVQFKILHRPGAGVRLLLSMSHALYDGISLGHITRDLSALYSGETLSEAPNFGAYVEYACSQEDKGRRYWQQLMEGASATLNAPDWPLTSISDGLPTVLRTTIRAPNPPLGTTPAMLFTAACAIVLARVAGSQADIVFTRVISIRSGLPAALQEVVGPCINTVPVRVPASAFAADRGSLSLRSSVNTLTVYLLRLRVQKDLNSRT